MKRWVRFPVASLFMIAREMVHPNPAGVIAFFLRRLHGDKGRSFIGFTLLELIVVIAIVGTLASIAVPAYWNYLEKARVTVAIADIRSIEKLIVIFQIENAAFPDNLDEIGMGNFKDPWGNPYRYLNLTDSNEDGNGNSGGGGGGGGGGGQTNERARKDHFMVPLNTDFDLYSMGRDGESRAPLTANASHDDVVRANSGQFVGLASAF